VIDWQSPRETYNYLTRNKIQPYVLYIPKRLKSIKKIMKKLDLSPIYVQGLDKNGITLKTSLDRGLVHPDWYDYSVKGDATETSEKKPVNPGRIACHLGHLAILERFLQSSDEYALIFEDDVYLTPGKSYERKHKLRTILENIPKNAQIVYLSYCYEFCDLTEKYNDIFLHAVRPLCRHIYLVSRDGARIILDNTLPMHNTGDKMCGNLIFDKILKGYLVDPKFFTLKQNRQPVGAFKTNLNNHGELFPCKERNFRSLNDAPYVSTQQILNK
jgi:GR25 family glycosyltransferase involved in LPS biosynthesis